MKTTKFQSVADAAADLAGDPQVAARVETEILRNSLVSHLIQMRVKKGVTQEQVAKVMGCDPSTVSRIEADNDRQLKWMQIMGYLRALNVQMSLSFFDGALPAADRIKQCVFKIDDDLKKLAILAKEVGGNDDIAQGIDRFYREVLFNFVSKFSENYSALRSVVQIACPQSTSLADTQDQDSEDREAQAADHQDLALSA